MIQINWLIQINWINIIAINESLQTDVSAKKKIECLWSSAFLIKFLLFPTPPLILNNLPRWWIVWQLILTYLNLRMEKKKYRSGINTYTGDGIVLQKRLSKISGAWFTMKEKTIWKDTALHQLKAGGNYLVATSKKEPFRSRFKYSFALK